MTLLTGDEIIEIAIRLEESGEAFYAAAAEGATDEQLKDLFEELSIQEQHHRRTFQRMGRDVIALALSPDQWDQFEAYTNALLQQRFLARPENALNLAVGSQDERAVLQAALDFEKETLLFFYELRSAVRNPGKQVVEGIIQEEKRHIQRLAGRLSGN